MKEFCTFLPRMSRPAFVAGPSLILSLLLSACAATPVEIDEGRLLNLAKDVDQQGDHATAAAMYERALEQNGPSADIQVRLGNALLASGEPQAAAEAFRAALAEDIHFAPALLGLGTAQLRLGQPESAAWSRLGAAQALAGQPARATSAFANAVALEPRDLDAQANLALAEALAGENTQAIANMQRITGSPLAEERHFRNLILVLVLAGRSDEAQQVDIPDLSAANRLSLIASAEHIATLPDAAARARALGLASASN